MNQENNTTDNREVKTVYMAPAEWCHPQMEDDEIDLISLIAVLWRRKKFIVGFTICLAALAAVVVMFVLTPQYKVSAMVSPGIIGFNQQGNPLYASSPSDIKEWLDSGAYVDEMISRMSEDAVAQGMIPKPGSLETDIKGGQIVRVNLFNPAPEKGVNILQDILDIFANNQKTYIYALKEKKNIIDQLRDDMETWQAHIDSISNRIEKLVQQIKEIEMKVQEIQTSRNEFPDSNGNEFTLNRYADAIQEHFDTLNRLEEKQYNFIMERSENTTSYQKSKNQIASLEAEISLLSPLKIVQKPTSSIEPVKPDKKMIVALATVMGLFMGIMLAFMMEFYSKFKHRLNET
jgi:LPS O-antigen subunit length determinant protein (WzzB/FepE family)